MRAREARASLPPMFVAPQRAIRQREAPAERSDARPWSQRTMVKRGILGQSQIATTSKRGRTKLSGEVNMCASLIRTDAWSTTVCTRWTMALVTPGLLFLFSSAPFKPRECKTDRELYEESERLNGSGCTFTTFVCIDCWFWRFAHWCKTVLIHFVFWWARAYFEKLRVLQESVSARFSWIRLSPETSCSRSSQCHFCFCDGL